MTEIFRHLRPKRYNMATHEIVTQKFGGISFMLKPVCEKTYDFWIYLCPKSAIFSTKQSVKTLRDRRDEGVVPFGRIVLDDSPLMDQLVAFVIKEKMELPSDASKLALEIILSNSHADFEKAKRAYFTHGRAWIEYTKDMKNAAAN